MTMTFGIFEEIERLIEYIPIECDNLQIDGRLSEGTLVDSKFYFEDLDGVATRLGVIEVKVEKKKGDTEFITLVSFRDIVRLLNKYLKDGRIEEITQRQRYKQLHLIKGFDYSVKALLFDFCLAALDGDSLNAKLYLRHSYHLLGLHRRLTLLLSVIANEISLREDKDIRQLLKLLAVMTEPNNIDVYYTNNGGLGTTYTTYLKELQNPTPAKIESDIVQQKERKQKYMRVFKW